MIPRQAERESLEEQFFANELRTLAGMFGLFGWAIAAVVLWSVTRNRFRRISSRMPYRRPDPLALANSEYRLLGEAR